MRFLWTSMPYLNISTDDFRTSHAFSEFVNHVLSHSNNQIELYSAKLTFHQMFRSVELLERIFYYAFSHHVQDLSITWLCGGKVEFPFYLLCSQSLKYLRFTGSRISFLSLRAYSILITSTWELPALTTWHLDHITFRVDNDDKGIGLFSKCANLKNLTISNFTVTGSRTFNVCHPQLSNLTLEYNSLWRLDAINVVAHKLKNLTITIRSNSKPVITAPKLASMLYHGSTLLQFSAYLHSLEKVDLHIADMYCSGCEIAYLLRQLHNVKFLMLNLEFLEPLISYLEEISLQPSPFSNLKKLKIYPVYIPLDDEAHNRVKLSTKVINYLLDGSPRATFTLISYEEIKEKWQKAQAFKNVAAAQRLMGKLQVMLEQEKANIATSRTRMDQGKTQMEADIHDQGKAPVEKVQVHFERKMAQMKSCWEGVGLQINRGRTKACDIISKLRGIEVLLLKDIPASKRDKCRG